MIRFAPCKINLGLHVVAKRSDGYHNIETCFLPVPWYDALEIIPAQHDKIEFSLSGVSIPGRKDDNLVMKAYDLLSKQFPIPKILCHLHKTIPTGAGLGGGSSDGASALFLLNKLFDLNLSVQQLESYASQLGSDCAFFIDPKPRIGRERGDVLEDVHVELSGKFLVIVKPEINVSTAEAYRDLRLIDHSQRIRQIIENADLSKWKDLLTNDFEESVFEKYPSIASIKSKLYETGAVYASMSGSGSSVFGIFHQPIDTSLFNKEGMVWSGLL